MIFLTYLRHRQACAHHSEKAPLRVRRAHALLFLDETLSVETLIIAYLPQFFDTKLLEVGRLRIELLVVPEAPRATARPWDMHMSGIVDA